MGSVAASVSLWNSPADGAKTGGDWCDVVTISDEAVALTVGDVAGHGEEVAGAMESVRSAMLRTIQRLQPPTVVLSAANGFAERDCGGAIVTGVVAYFDHRRGTLTYANAGHPPPLIMTAHGHTFLTQACADLPLGIFPQHQATNYVVSLPEDALVVFYTDGVTERERDPVRGETELTEAARHVFERSEMNAARAIAERVFAKGRGSDDAATMVLRTTPMRF